jgi:single-stranded-DNA-specific exonuclease
LIRYGGHKYAAGLSIARSEIESFRKKLSEVSRQLLTDEDLIPKIDIDAEIALEDVDEKLIDTLELFAPFGPSNARPVFVTRHLEVAGDPVVVGNNHLKLRLRQQDSVLDAIGFGMGRFALPLARARRADFAYSLEFNEWNGQRKIQLRLRDIHLQ